MKHSIFAVSGILIVALAAPAGAVTRASSITTAHGTTTHAASASCTGGTCSRQSTTMRPNGTTSSSSGSVSCGAGTCSSTRSATHPYGTTTTSAGTMYGNGSYAHSSTTTGARGAVYQRTSTGSVTRPVPAATP